MSCWQTRMWCQNCSRNPQSSPKLEGQVLEGRLGSKLSDKRRERAYVKLCRISDVCQIPNKICNYNFKILLMFYVSGRNHTYFISGYLWEEQNVFVQGLDYPPTLNTFLIFHLEVIKILPGQCCLLEIEISKQRNERVFQKFMG